MPKKTPTTQKRDLSFSSLSREELEILIRNLYSRFEIVRNFVDINLNKESSDVLKKYKTLLKNRLIEDIEEGTNGLFSALDAVEEFILLNPSPRDQADIMLFFTETAVYCIGDFGDLYDEFYEEAENMFEQALKFIKHHRLLAEFRERSETVVHESDDFGYGFHDSLQDTFSIYYNIGNSKKIPAVRKPVAVKKIKKAMPKKPAS